MYTIKLPKFWQHDPACGGTVPWPRLRNPRSARQQLHLSTIAAFTTDIRHVAGKDNPRGQVSSVHLSIDYATRAADQQADGDIQAFRTAKTGLCFEDMTFQDSSAILLCDVSTGRVRPMVPDGWRRRVFDAVHSLSHPGVRSSVKLVAARFFWPGLRKEVRKWAAACLACQRAKMHRHMKTPLEPVSDSGVALQPRAHRFSRAASALPWIYLPPHHGGQDHKVARGHALVFRHVGRGGLGVYLHLGAPFRHASGPGQDCAVHLRAVDDGRREPVSPASSDGVIQPAG